MPDLNPTAGVCGLLHFQGVGHPWLSQATETCCDLLLRDPPLEAHTLLCAARLADRLPDRALAKRLYDAIASALPLARALFRGTDRRAPPGPARLSACGRRMADPLGTARAGGGAGVARAMDAGGGSHFGGPRIDLELW